MSFQLASDQVNELATALSKAQSQMTHASKDSQNPHFKNDYASLASVIGAGRTALAMNALSIVQATMPSESGLLLVTTLMHSSGQWQRSFTPILMTKQDAQGMGSALTYARRYSYSAIIGIAQYDDDGDGAGKAPQSPPPPNGQSTPAPQAQAPKPVAQVAQKPYVQATPTRPNQSRQPDARGITDPGDYTITKANGAWETRKIRDVVNEIGLPHFMKSVNWWAIESGRKHWSEIQSLKQYADEFEQDLHANHADSLQIANIQSKIDDDNFDSTFAKGAVK